METEPSEERSSPDWGTLILEVQTDPAGPHQCPALGQIFQALFPFLRVLAVKWRQKHRLCEDTRDELAIAGWDKISTEIGKFAIPEDGPDGIGRAFKAWVSICSRRQWDRVARANPVATMDPLELSEHLPAAPSLEELMDDERQSKGSPEFIERSSRERQIQQESLRQELDRLAPSMRDALLETEDGKSIISPNARGRTGEADEIAVKYGHTAGAVRTCRSRVCDRVKARFASEVANG